MIEIERRNEFHSYCQKKNILFLSIYGYAICKNNHIFLSFHFYYLLWYNHQFIIFADESFWKWINLIYAINGRKQFPKGGYYKQFVQSPMIVVK